jgi:hypothetical protein
MNWRKATLIAASANFIFYLVALAVGDGAWRAARESPMFTLLFSFCPQIASAVVVYAASTWLSRSKIASPVLAPASLVLLGMFIYGGVIFRGSSDPNTAGQMAVFFGGLVQCMVLTFVFGVTWVAAQWIGRFRRRIGPTV